MNWFWKSLTVLTFLISVIALVYAYAAAHPNPYSQERLELQQLQMDVKAIKDQLATRPQ